jgi:hypothetical protein
MSRSGLDSNGDSSGESISYSSSCMVWRHIWFPYSYFSDIIPFYSESLET